MEIKTIEVRNLTASGFKNKTENDRHMKTLPCLSIVQALHGYYEIGLDGQPLQSTGEGGAFVAPSGIRQDIVHHSGLNGFMEAQWVFMNVFINECYALEDIYDIPTVLPAKYGAVLNRLISQIRNEHSICRQYAAAYQLLDVMLSQSVQKRTAFDSVVAQIKRFVDEHYAEAIRKEELAAAAACSVPNLYRIFQKHFHLSPHNYINKVRLEKASVLLESSGLPITLVAQKVGFKDPAYFSTLFKENYGRSPQKYREMVHSLKGGR